MASQFDFNLLRIAHPKHWDRLIDNPDKNIRMHIAYNGNRQQAQKLLSDPDRFVSLAASMNLREKYLNGE